MKKSLIIYLFSFFIFSHLIGQNTFQKDIGIAFDTSFIRCQPDGKAVFLVGQIKSFSQLDIHFLKISDVGDVLWHKRYSTPSSVYAFQKTLLQSDGLLTLFSGKDSAFLLKMNLQDGSVAWRKDFGQNGRLMLFDMGCDGKENIWLGGLHYKKTERDSNYYFHLKLTREGSPIMGKQARTYYNGPSYLDDRVYKPTDLLWNSFTQSMFMVQNYPTGEYTKTSFLSGNGEVKDRRVSLAVADTNMQYQEYYYQPDWGDWVITKNHISFTGSVIFPAFTYQIGLLDKDGKRFHKRRDVDGKMTTIHNYDGSIVFYNLKYKTLTKYNESFEPVWTKKYDNCYNVSSFDADIAQDGTIFTVRNVAEKTIVSKITKDGMLPDCIDYNAKSPENPTFLSTENPAIYNLFNTDYIIPLIMRIMG